MQPYYIVPGTSCFYIKRGERYIFKTCGDSVENQKEAEKLVEALNLLMELSLI